MDYDEFVRRYREGRRAWLLGRADRATAAVDLARLRAAVPTVEPAAKRQTAGELLDHWAAETAPEAVDRMNRAVAALGRAERDDGTVAERVARAEAGIAEIGRIAAEAPDPGERSALNGLTETLARLADALRRSRP
jgi:hypothetical protein